MVKPLSTGVGAHSHTHSPKEEDMARRKKKKKEEEEKPLSDEDLLDAIVKGVSGAEILDQNTILQQGFINTTSLALNYIASGKFVDGGIPKGRITQIYGPSSSAKTVIATHILQGCQKQDGISALIDSESAYSPKFSETLGIDTRRLIYLQPDHLEACFGKVRDIGMLVAKKGDQRAVAVVYDSIAASPSAKEFNELMEQNDEPAAEMGERARVCSRELRKIASLLNKLNCAFVVVNQIRSKIGVMYGNPETTAGGGNSLEYYCSLMLDCRRGKPIKDSRKRDIGVHVNLRCTKNKCWKPFGKALNLRLYWDYGIDPCSGLLQILIDADKLVPGSPGWYHLRENEDAKFQARKDDNYVPRDFLLEHPETVDSTREELEAFLGMNESAVSVSDSGNVESDPEPVEEDEEGE